MLRVLSVLVLVFCSAIAAAQSLRVGMALDYPPLVYKQDGEIVGIEADNARTVGKMLNLKMRLVELPFDRLLPALQAGEIDVVMSGVSITPERAEKVTFIAPYLNIGQMAITHRDKIASYAQPWSVYREGVRIGVEPDTTGAQFAAEELSEAVIKFYENPEAAFAALRKDEIDLYVHDAPTSWQLATSGEFNDLISLYSPLTNEQLAWAVRKGDDALAEDLNRALRTMKANGTLRYILNRWIPVTVEVR